MTAVTEQVSCSKCQVPLLEQRKEKNAVAVTPCGHIFHKTCLEDVRLSVKSADGSNKKYYLNCTKCKESFEWYRKSERVAGQVDLYLDKRADLELAFDKLKFENWCHETDKKKLSEEKGLMENEIEMLQEKIKELEKENRQLIQENELEQEIRELENENKSLLEENEALMEVKRVEEVYKIVREDRNRLELEVSKLETEAKHLRTENTEVTKRMITAEIKLTLLTKGDLLEEKFGELKWNEITSTFQKELLEKVQIPGRPFINLDKILPINTKALMRLIRTGEKDETLLQKIIEDYFEERKQSTDKVTWDDLDESLRVYLASKLHETNLECLDLDDVPLSCSTLVHLIIDKNENNPGYLGKIVTRYVDEMVNESLTLVNDLFKLALLECINSEVIGCLEVHFLNPQALERLVEVGMLRKTDSEFEAPYEFSHDSVRFCIIGMIMSKLMEQVKVSRMNAFNLFHESYTYAYPLGHYFADYMSGVEQSYLANFAFVEISDNTLANLFMTFSVMRLPSLEPVIAVLKHCNMDVLDIVLPRKVPQVEDLTITLLHAAAIRGDLERVKCLLYEFGFSKKLDGKVLGKLTEAGELVSPDGRVIGKVGPNGEIVGYDGKVLAKAGPAVIVFESGEFVGPCFQNLILACVENTKECKDEQIEQRKEILKELVKLNGDLLNCGPPSASLNVHDGLIKVMVGLGADSWFPLLAT